MLIQTLRVKFNYLHLRNTSIEHMRRMEHNNGDYSEYSRRQRERFQDRI